MSAAEVRSEVASLQLGAAPLLDDQLIAGLAETLGSVDISTVPQDGGELPRGVYQYDHDADAWELVGGSQDLDLNWDIEPGSGPPARLLVDWDASAPTVERTVPEGSIVELPQGANAVLTVDGVELANVDQTAQWPVNECGYLTEPGSFRLDGAASADGSSLTFDQVGFTLDATSTSASATSGGRVELANASGDAWLDWDASLQAGIERDPITCEIVDGDVTSGSLAFDAGVDTIAGQHAVGFATNFDVLSPPGADDLAIGLSGGRLTLNGSVAVTWNGVLDDENGNGVPGENLALTFSDGTVTLEEYLQQHFPFAVAAARVASALR